MCIYSGKRNSKVYRKIYEQHNGPIPKEKCGRSYEIHHIDGNHQNNELANLIAVTLQEHYDIHYAQCEFRACALMKGKLNLSATDLATLNSLSAKERVKNGTHNFLGKDSNKARLKAGTHNSQIKDCSVKCRKEVSSNNVGQHSNKCSSQSNT